MELMTVKQVAEKWGLSERRLRYDTRSYKVWSRVGNSYGCEEVGG